MDRRDLFFPKKNKTKEDKIKAYEIIKKYSLECGYELISTEYINSSEPFIWKNKDGIIIKTQISNIRNTGWPVNNNFLNDIKKIAHNRGGKILSLNYVNSKQKVLCEDSFGNKFEMTPNNIKNGHWSPYDKCVTEHLCRQILESYFNTKFPQRWDIIKKKGIIKLQLDGYNENVLISDKYYKLAFEYQGYGTHFNNKKTIIFDEYKKIFCKNNNIILFVIDKINFRLDNEELLNKHVYDVIKHKLGDDCPKFKMVKLNYKNINHSTERLNHWREIGKRDGYILLSTEYKHSTAPLSWKSPNGVIFERSPQTMCGRNKWPTFSKISNAFLKSKKEFYKEIQHFGEINGYKLLSEEYISRNSPLIWESIDNIKFKRSWATIKKDGWPTFSKFSISKMSII